MKRLGLHTTLVAVFALSACHESPVDLTDARQPSPELAVVATDTDVLGFGFVRAVNSSGAVLGFIGGQTGIWTPSGITPLPSGAWDGSDINENGMVTGLAFGGQPFRWTPGGAFELLPKVGHKNQEFAWTLNDLGHVVGYIQDPWCCDPMLWTPEDGYTLLPGLPGRHLGEARDINNSGQIVGMLYGTSGGFRFERAVLWDGGLATDLGTFGVNSWARAINEQGWVAGSVGSSEGERGFLWTPEWGMIDLGVAPDARQSRALDIDDEGRVVGLEKLGIVGSDGFRAVVWTVRMSPEGLRIRRDQIAPQWDFSYAVAISPNGRYAVGKAEQEGQGEVSVRWTLDSATPESLLADLESQVAVLVASGRINGGEGRSLEAKVSAALASYVRGQSTAAVKQLNSLVNELEALRLSGRVDADVVDAMIVTALDAIELIEDEAG